MALSEDGGADGDLLPDDRLRWDPAALDGR